MKYKKIIKLLLLVISIVIYIPISLSNNLPIDKIIATVNNNIILKSDIDNYLLINPENKNIKNIRNKILNLLIEKELLLQIIFKKKKYIKIKDNLIKNKNFKNLNFELKKYKNKIEKNFLINKIIQDNIIDYYLLYRYNIFLKKNLIFLIKNINKYINKLINIKILINKKIKINKIINNNLLKKKIKIIIIKQNIHNYPIYKIYNKNISKYLVFEILKNGKIKKNYFLYNTKNYNNNIYHINKTKNFFLNIKTPLLIKLMFSKIKNKNNLTKKKFKEICINTFIKNKNNNNYIYNNIYWFQWNELNTKIKNLFINYKINNTNKLYINKKNCNYTNIIKYIPINNNIIEIIKSNILDNYIKFYLNKYIKNYINSIKKKSLIKINYPI